MGRSLKHSGKSSWAGKSLRSHLSGETMTRSLVSSVSPLGPLGLLHLILGPGATEREHGSGELDTNGTPQQGRL